MADPLAQRYAVKFCVLLGKNTVETNEMINQAFKDKALSESSVRKWHKMFRDGREEVTDEARSGRPSTSRTDENVDRVLQLLNEDRRQGVRLIAQTLNLAKKAPAEGQSRAARPERQLAAAPRQCAFAHSLHCQRLPGESRRPSGPAASPQS